MNVHLGPLATAGRLLLTQVPVSVKVAACRIKIDSPVDGTPVPSKTFIVYGRYWKTLGLRFVIFHQQGKRYWPQGSPEFNPTRHRWEKQVSVGDADPGQASSIVVAAVSDDLLTAFSYYGQVFDKTKQWVPIQSATAPKGLTEAARIVLTHVGT
jgi:hypothetical protein